MFPLRLRLFTFFIVKSVLMFCLPEFALTYNSRHHSSRGSRPLPGLGLEWDCRYGPVTETHIQKLSPHTCHAFPTSFSLDK